MHKNVIFSKQITNNQDKYDIAASFQKTVEEIMYKKTITAFNEFEKINKLEKKIFVIAGGVAANKNLRKMFKKLCDEKNFEAIS